MAASLLLAGCAHEPRRHYPSLAPRPIEKVGFGEPARPAVIVAPDAALDAEIARQGEELRQVTAGFDAAAAPATRSVEHATAKPVGSDAWLDAQAALVPLDGWRTRAGALAAAVAATASARAGALQPAYPALDDLAARTAAEAEREAAATEQLQRRLPAA